MVAVSVVMSAYNEEAYLSEAVESVLNQSFQDFELIIVDDGSDDNSAEILQRYAARDQRVKILKNDKNIGIAASLNRGLETAQATLVARMDADDICMPQRLERQLSFMEAHPDIDVLGSALMLHGTRKIRRRPEAHDMIVAELLFNCSIFHPTVMLRTERAHGGGLFGNSVYDPRQQHAEDYGLWVRLAIQGGARFANLPNPLLVYRIHNGSITRRYTAQQNSTAIAIKRWQLKKLGISPTVAEMNLHNVISGRISSQTIQSYDDCDRWLKRLAEANIVERIYPTEAFASLIRRKRRSVRKRRWLRFLSK